MQFQCNASMYVCVYMYVNYVYVCICMHMSMYVYMYVYVYVYVYVFVYVYVYVYHNHCDIWMCLKFEEVLSRCRIILTEAIIIRHGILGSLVMYRWVRNVFFRIDPHEMDYFSRQSRGHQIWRKPWVSSSVFHQGQLEALPDS